MSSASLVRGTRWWVLPIFLVLAGTALVAFAPPLVGVALAECTTTPPPVE